MFSYVVHQREPIKILEKSRSLDSNQTKKKDMKIADSVLLSLSRDNGNNSHALSTGLNGIQFLILNVFESLIPKDQKKYNNTEKKLLLKQFLKRCKVFLLPIYTRNNCMYRGLVHFIRDGNCFFFQVFQSTCSVDITYFPFDVQECKLKFVAWSYSKFEVIQYV